MPREEIENVSARVKNTRKEIEQLKNDLEKLIHLGTAPAPTIQCKPQEIPVIRSHELKKSPQKSKPTEAKKVRTYNVAETREFIKKQKEKRAEQLKAQINIVDHKLDEKKQKLKDLHLKTKALVAKNVELKRARSKSREPEIRLDKASSRSRSKSREPVRNNSQTRTEPQKSGSKKGDQVSTATTQTQRASRERWKEKVPDPNLLYPPSTKDLDIAMMPPVNSESELNKATILNDTVKDNKETQTAQNLETTNWIPATVPYPYNFINTVKKKLQFVVNSPAHHSHGAVDVAVQNSNLSTPNATKTKEEIKDMLVRSSKSELKSFASHKCLDLKAVESLGLRSHQNKESLSRNLFNSYDSESDTSKNIPEISSESYLSLEKLKNLKLKTASDEKSSTIISELSHDVTTKENHVSDKPCTITSATGASTSSVLETGKDSYISDFHDEHATNTQNNKQDDEASQLSTTSLFTESLSLQEPTVSLSVKRDSNKSLLNTITVRSPKTSSEDTLIGTVKSTKSGVEISNVGIPETESVKATLDTKANLVKSQLRNITVRPTSTQNNVNEVHLKFEAEVRLLNDFNESFKQFMALDQAFQNIKNNTDTNLTKLVQNVDTQTSIIAKDSSVNYSRGSEIIEELNGTVGNTVSSLNSVIDTSDFNLSNLNASSITNLTSYEEERLSISNIENLNGPNMVSLSLFDQLIKDEDVRIQQLKAIIRIRQQALLDRTKGELVWLEIQKKQLLETGKFEQASLLRKKQRGIIVKHEQERNEIKKLKQMQKEASENRKKNLKQQRNLIKVQLSTENMLSSKIVIQNRKERRCSGPLRVVQSSESIHSEASISLRSSGIEDAKEVSFVEEGRVSNAKKRLQMRESALQKRRKAAEELLRWHRQLLEEERKIGELEKKAAAVVAGKERDRHEFDGRQLNQLWRSMTGVEEKRFVDGKLYVMSQVALERLCKSARINGKGRTPSEINYSSAFDSESEKSKISSISELIDDFSKIGEDISILGKKAEDKISEKDHSLKEKTDVSEISSIRDEEDSVVEVVQKESSSTTRTEQTGEEENVTNEEFLPSKVSSQIEEASKGSSQIEESGRGAESKVEEILTVAESTSKIEEPSSELNDKLTSNNEEEDVKSSVEENIESPSKAATEETSYEQSQGEDIVVINEETEEKSDSKSKQITESMMKHEDLEDTTKNTSPSVVEDCQNELSRSVSFAQIEELLSPVEETSSSKPSEETSTEELSSKKDQIDVKKRVSEILADANPSRGEKSPRLQDLYVTAYDVGASPLVENNETGEKGSQLPTNILDNEAEELWRKQLAIEQEIKQIELQQKEQVPFVFMREIPNKPPPPYTPPSSLSSLTFTIIPFETKEIDEIASYSSKVLFKAQENNNLEIVKFSENGFKLFSKVKVSKMCGEFMFNICRDLVKTHYKQYERIEEPIWLSLPKPPQWAKTKPLDSQGLERFLAQRLKELFGFKKVQSHESAIIKWGRKKRDPVDEVLAMESQEEESQWTNFDKDELIVKSQVVDEIMKMLIEETRDVFVKIMAKKRAV